MQFKQFTLPNGLQVISEFNSDVYSVAVGFFVRTGARDEIAQISGVSHFLEHMAFKGTSTRSAEDVNRTFDEIGAKYNASTGEEVTLFYAAILPEYFPEAFSLLADIVFPALRKTDFDMEKNVILEEIGMYKDQPSFVAYDHLMQTHFNGHPLGQCILGSNESITNLSCEEMQNYHHNRYHAGNIVIAIAGATNETQVLELAQKFCAHWPKGQHQRILTEAEPVPQLLSIQKENVMQQIVMQMGKAPSASHDLHYPAEILTCIIGDHSSSRLYWALVDGGEADSADLDYHDYEGSGAYLTYLSCAPEDVIENLGIIQGIYDDVNANGVTQEELEIAKSKLMSRLVLRSERPMGRLSSLGGNWIYRGEYRSVDHDLKTIDELSLNDIRKLLDAYPLKMVTSVTVGPMEQSQFEGALPVQ